jgi:hypothetical protein
LNNHKELPTSLLIDQINCICVAILTSEAVFFASSFANRFFRCVSTVVTLINNFCAISIPGKNKKELLNLPDAFEDMKEGTPAAEAKILHASLNTGEPMAIGETYHLRVRFFDKNKKENEIVSGVDLIVNK